MLTPFAFQQIGTVEASLPVANPALWLDASRSDTLFVENTLTTPVTTDNGPVGGWKDLSGNNRHALQSGTNRPTWRTPINGQNGLGVMSFNGSTQYFDVASLPSLASGYTFYAVLKQPTATGAVISSASAGVDGSTAAMITGPGITAVGNAQISTTQSKHGGASGYFDGTGDWVVSGSSTAFAYGTGDFTWEMWFNSTSWASSNNYLMDHGTSTGGSVQYYNGVMRYYNATTGAASTLYTTGFGSGLSTGVWYHLAACRQSGVTRLFRDGVLISSASDSYNYPANRIVIGAAGSLGQPFNGFIDDVRISKVARYTSAFTPSAVPLPDTAATDSNFAQTSLLLHMDGANGSTVFTDSSNNVGTGITQGGRSIAQPVVAGTVVGVIGNYDGTHTAGNYFVRTSSSAANVSGVMTQTASTPATGTASIGRLTNATAYFNSQIYELVVLPRQSNSTEDQAWKDYTTAKWGITWS